MRCIPRGRRFVGKRIACRLLRAAFAAALAGSGAASAQALISPVVVEFGPKQRIATVRITLSDKAIKQLESADGWELGTGPSIVVVDEGAAANLTTRTAKEDVYAFTFDQKGLMGGIGIQGTKISRLERP